VRPLRSAPPPKQQGAAAVNPPEPGERTLDGRVLDAGGGVIPGARVRATSYALNAGGTHDKRTFQADSDSEGRYQLRLPSGVHALFASADGYAPATQSLDMSFDRTKDFILQPAARISGRVVTAEGRVPVAGAQVAGHRDGWRDPVQDPVVTTDERGVFVLHALLPGTYMASARTKNRFGELARWVALGAADAVDDVEIVVSPTFAVRGKVTSAVGAPLPRASINVWSLDRPIHLSNPPARALADDDGQYVVEGIPPGGHRLVVSAGGYATHIEPITLSSDLSRDVVLPDTAVVTGVVLTSSGRPATRALVRGFLLTSSEGGGPSVDAFTDGQGRFSLGGLGGGVVMLTATARSETGGGPETLDNGGRKEVTIRLRPGARVSGLVTWEDGSPSAAFLAVRVSSLEGRGQFNVEGHASRDGSFTIPAIPPGEISLRALPLGRPIAELGSDEVTLRLDAGVQRTDVKLVMRR
jgi:hypothetical protein